VWHLHAAPSTVESGRILLSSNPGGINGDVDLPARNNRADMNVDPSRNYTASCF
jgi:hypothetical protein